MKRTLKTLKHTHISDAYGTHPKTDVGWQHPDGTRSASRYDYHLTAAECVAMAESISKKLEKRS